MRAKAFKSFDGTRIAYYVSGKGRRPVVLVNGLGGTMLVWKDLIKAGKDEFTFYSWDYRALFDSDPPKDPDALSVYDHAEDLRRMMEQEKLKKVALVGWSMGVQVSLAFYERYPALVKRMVLLNGAAGHMMDAITLFPGSRKVLGLLTERLRERHEVVSRVTKSVVGWECSPQLIRLIRFARRNEKEFIELARRYAQVDFERYFTVLLRANEYTGFDVLPNIKCPVLAIAGEKDFLCQLSAVLRTVNLIPECHFYLVRGGTHYCLLEYPETVVPLILEFISSRNDSLSLRTSQAS